mmetsp:Transcript_12396/g.26733  ORF Transcript_12396/g.26733 Transcript_12396/m.26733 type:complete len:256 (+) Transcript_12396:1401-2168(+)
MVRGGTGACSPGSRTIIVFPGYTPSGQMTPMTFFPPPRRTWKTSPGATSGGTVTVRNVVGWTSGGGGMIEAAGLAIGFNGLVGTVPPLWMAGTACSTGLRGKDEGGKEDSIALLCRDLAPCRGSVDTEVGAPATFCFVLAAAAVFFLFFSGAPFFSKLFSQTSPSVLVRATSTRSTVSSRSDRGRSPSGRRGRFRLVTSLFAGGGHAAALIDLPSLAEEVVVAPSFGLGLSFAVIESVVVAVVVVVTGFSLLGIT